MRKRKQEEEQKDEEEEEGEEEEEEKGEEEEEEMMKRSRDELRLAVPTLLSQFTTRSDINNCICLNNTCSLA